MSSATSRGPELLQLKNCVFGQGTATKRSRCNESLSWRLTLVVHACVFHGLFFDIMCLTTTHRHMDALYHAAGRPSGFEGVTQSTPLQPQQPPIKRTFRDSYRSFV